jgi:hypothetical protein
VINGALKSKTEQKAHSDWDQFLSTIAHACNIGDVEGTGRSPLLGHHPTLPTDILYGSESLLDTDRKEYALELPRIMMQHVLRNASTMLLENVIMILHTKM